MRKILLSTTNEEESRLAVIDNGSLTDYLSVISGQEDRRGSILCGIISEVEPSLEACFVDIGDNKKGFLQFSDIHQDCLLDKEGPVSGRLSKGQPILVQVTKDSRSKKGPLLTTRVKMQSHHLLLMTRDKEPEGLRVSRKASDSERDRILEASDKLGIEDDMSMIVRSNGLDKPIDSLAWEKDSLLSLWQLILKVFAKQEEPTLIFEYRNIVNICLSEYLTDNTEELVCDSEATLQEIKDLLVSMGNSMVEKVRCVADDETLFNDSVLKQVDALVSHKVTLPSGGEIVIDITEALVAIDVNSGRSRGNKGIEATALSTNTEAATEIARQLKLRNLSGLVVIDFIDMENSANRERLENHMRRSLRADRAQISTTRISQFGLLEMTRQYIGRPMHESHSTLCEHCSGTGRLPTVRAFAVSILDKVQDLCINRKQVGTIYVELTVDAATYILNEKRDELRRIREDFGVEVIILPSLHMQGGDSSFRVDKVARAADKAKPSYEHRASGSVEQDSYIKELKSGRKLMAAAITGSVQPRQQPRQQPRKDSPKTQAQPDDDTQLSKTAFSVGKFLRSIITSAKTAETASEDSAAESELPRRDSRSGDRKRPRKSASADGARKEGSRRKPKGRPRSRKKPPYERKSDDGDQESPASREPGDKTDDAPARKRRDRPPRRKSAPETPDSRADSDSQGKREGVAQDRSKQGPGEGSSLPHSDGMASTASSDEAKEASASASASVPSAESNDGRNSQDTPAPAGAGGQNDAKPSDDREPVTESTAADAQATRVRRRDRGNTVRKASRTTF